MHPCEKLQSEITNVGIQAGRYTKMMDSNKEMRKCSAAKRAIEKDAKYKNISEAEKKLIAKRITVAEFLFEICSPEDKEAIKKERRTTKGQISGQLKFDSVAAAVDAFSDESDDEYTD
ncbi:uncharacterized protein LOC122854952 isoform X2 [Aphidius gifuensis]|uniref:uncharacterized protein LOC122854952 isoform X2 n=1 Tax=Aphidius gifuensis TaxID=684658 RepID=UPI001CDD237C|nr:uncharacterized protein LOC122854952 isoform X2 [Aphidius gifuensis]